jgi:hypothetical protein
MRINNVVRRTLEDISIADMAQPISMHFEPEVLSHENSDRKNRLIP